MEYIQVLVHAYRCYNLLYSWAFFEVEVEVEGPEIAILKDAHGLIFEDMWLDEISHLIMQFRRFMFSLPSPESNLATLVLAQYGSSTKSHDIWIEEEPSVIQGIL
jgi:hypothetical protein